MAAKTPNTIAPTSPFGKAILDFFNILEPVYSSGTCGQFEVIVFGGCAVHIHTQARGSADIDAEIASFGKADRSEILALLDEEAYVFADDSGVQRTLERDAKFNTTLAPIHEDYPDRVVRLYSEMSNPNIRVFIASAVDVAITKLGRFGHQDQEDILELLSLPSVSVTEFERLAKEAIDYSIGDKNRFLGNLDWILRAHATREQY